MMDADGSNPTRLTNSARGDHSPSWSPDGTKIVFVSFRNGNVEIYVMDADGMNPTNLTNNETSDFIPSWSPFQHIGSALVGASVTRTMLTQNPGTSRLMVKSITSSDGQFRVNAPRFAVPPGGRRKVRVRFRPLTAGTSYATLTITSNDPKNPVIRLIVNGTGVGGNGGALVEGLPNRKGRRCTNGDPDPSLPTHHLCGEQLPLGIVDCLNPADHL